VANAKAARLQLVNPATGAPLSAMQTWLAIAVMTFGTSFMSLVVVSLAPVLPEIGKHFGAGGGDLARVIQVAPAFGTIFGAPVSGWIVERLGARRFLLWAFALFGLFGSAGLYLDDLTLLIASRFLLGISAAGIVTAALYIISEYFDGDARARILGYQSAVGGVAAMAIGPIAGLIAEAGGWHGPFSLYLLGFPFALITWFAFPPDARRKAKAKQASGGGSILSLVPLLALVVVFFVGSYMSNVQIPFLLDEDGVTTPFLRSLVPSLSAGMVALGSATFGAIRARIGDRWTLRLAGGLMGFGIIFMGAVDTGVLAAIGCAISGLGIGIMNPQVNHLLISQAAPEARGRAAGLGYTARYIGNFLNPVVVKPLADMWGLHGAFVAIGAVFAAGTALDLVRPARETPPMRQAT
jgi:MFS family permease